MRRQKGENKWYYQQITRIGKNYKTKKGGAKWSALNAMLTSLTQEKSKSISKCMIKQVTDSPGLDHAVAVGEITFLNYQEKLILDRLSNKMRKVNTMQDKTISHLPRTILIKLAKEFGHYSPGELSNIELADFISRSIP